MAAMSNAPATNQRLLVTTGPESAGKTTLARELSRQLQTPLVTEQSRSYLERLYNSGAAHYTKADLLEIAHLQHTAEREALASGTPLVVCDTDLLVILVWSEVRYGHCEPALLQLFERALHWPRHYLLCDPSIPWEADPLRENPHDRPALLQRYIDKLNTLRLPWQLVSGSPSERLQSALPTSGGSRGQSI